MSTLSVRGNPLGESSKENRPAKSGKAGTSKRSVLGNVTNQVRIQPVRAAKDKHSVLQASKSGAGGQENVGCGAQKKACSGGLSSFSIFQDVAVVQPRPVAAARVPPIVHEEPMNDQENFIPEQDPHLNEAVMGLNGGGALQHLAPLAPLQVNLEPLDDSPMVVDSPREVKSLDRQDDFGLGPYYDDIYKYLRSIESTSRPGKNYMSRQTDVTTSMRNILVDWLVEVGEEYKLNRETLFLAISYIDKFLSIVGVQRPKLQLVGTASMFIAAKYEEIYPPDVGEFVYITDDTYTKAQVLKMESVILKLLDFKVAFPTINWFCEHFLELLDMDERGKHLAFFLTELSLIEMEGFVQFPPSMIAASAIVLARCTLGLSEPWPTKLACASRYSVMDLHSCVFSLYRLHTKARELPQQAVVEKYKQLKYSQVSLLTPPALLNLE
ncbi:G2/mitotic-specific cyclin-A [Aplysia californica]|uniref:G2/mitotic-specific cyclin-A n=1 Tax=Aplysia californica TaxID=6500 RepID=A0ABM1ABK8_APLCA|nr:G2/mitotic-specific cyclin-A [Aplysia californica]